MIRFRLAVWLLNFPALRKLAYVIMTKEELEMLRDLLVLYNKVDFKDEQKGTWE